MNTYLYFIAILFMIQTKAVSQEEPYRKAEISNRIEIEGDLNFAWTYLSNLGNLQHLVPSTIKKSDLTGNGKGSIVTLTLNNNATIVEEVIKLDNKKRQIEYIMLSTPLPIKNYKAKFTVNPISETRFEVIFHAEYNVQDKNREVRRDAFKALQLELLENLKLYTIEKR